jgi:predicted nucleotidyltransferase component of viral defense system
MKRKPTNLPASVLARLRNVAREKNTDYQLILRRYAIERLLHRLSISQYRDQFVLKGAMLFTAWFEDPFRPTQDLDLLGHGDPATSTIEAVFRAICQTETEDDGLVFDADGLNAQPIREDQQYGGVRIKTKALLGKTQIPVQVDIGFGDAITPAAQELEFPPLLSPEGPRLNAYTKETVVAEKLQAIVVLGRANSRMKDFYDLLALSRLFEFEGRTLASAIRATFERRGTAVPTAVPDGLDDKFAEDEEKRRQWTAFVRREPLLIAAPSLKKTIDEIASFALPPVNALSTDGEFDFRWVDGGPWEL